MKLKKCSLNREVIVMDIKELINKDNIIIDIEVKDKKDIFKVMAEHLKQSGVVNNTNGFVQAVLDRENEYSTGIGFEIAVPHAQSKYINKSAIAVARLKNKIEYESIDGENVKLIFMIAVPEKENQEHLRILSALSRKFMDDKFRESIKSAKSKDELYEILCKI